MLFKETTSFSSRVKVITPIEYCEQLSLASLSDLKRLLPEGIDVEGNPDLLWNAFNAAVANRANANDDGIDTDSALEISKNFIHKFTDIEHDRTQIVGHIASQGFSTFGDNQIVAAESLGSSKTPFNIALGAVVYKLANPDFAKLLVESSDETSAKFNMVSASWELGFTKYNILLGHRDLAEGELVTDPEQVKEFKKFLKAYGGKGRTDDGVPVFRMIIGGLPLGIGYTASPAADVAGVVVDDGEKEAEASRESIVITSGVEAQQAVVELAAAIATFKNNQESAKTFSQTTNPPVKKDSNMEIKSLSDINDETLKNVSAASIVDFIKSELAKSNDEYVTKVAAKEGEVKTLSEQVSAFEASLKAATDTITKTNEELVKVQSAQAKEIADRAFNERMASIDEKFTLTEKLSAIIAKEINGLDDAAYQAWLEKSEILFAHLLKTKETVVASTVVDPAVAAAAVVAAVVVDPAAAVIPANASVAAEPTMRQKYAEAFSEESIKVSSFRR